jgi:regulator of protease activity HflC (stomatin/prohibitin superfamily)
MEHLEPPPGTETDPAMKSLADALRVSFRVLSAMMAVFVVLFLATGVGSISPQERGLVKVFGKITRVAKEGFVYNWPFPIGEIEKVNIQERQIRIEDFWLYETAKDKHVVDLASRDRTNNGLRPGWDGYLLTGDRNLVHVKFLCRYQVQDPVAVQTRVADLEPVLRDALCRAAVQAGAVRTADAIQVDPTGFLNDVKTTAQAELDALLNAKPGEPAVRINSVLSENKTWPLAAYTAYEQAQKARTEHATKINKAISEARDLTKVIVEEYLLQLVGQPWNRKLQEEAEFAKAGQRDGKPYNLIGRLSYLEGELRQAQASNAKPEDLQAIQKNMDETQVKIEKILTSAEARGEVQNIISDAYSKKTAIIQQAQKRADAFRQRYAQYVKAPAMFLENEWASALDDVFNAPTNTKYYINPGKKGDVVYINRDPTVMKEIRDYLRKKKNEEEQKK